METAQIIEEIKQLSPEQRAEVLKSLLELEAAERLSGIELTKLARQMVESKDPEEAELLKEKIARGFYGEE